MKKQAITLLLLLILCLVFGDGASAVGDGLQASKQTQGLGDCKNASNVVVDRVGEVLKDRIRQRVEVELKTARSLGLDPERVAPATAEVIAERQINNIESPRLRIPYKEYDVIEKGFMKTASEWFARHKDRAYKYSYHKTKGHGGRSRVLEVIIDGVKYYFRRISLHHIDLMRAARKTEAAFILNRALKLKTASDAKIVKLNADLGVLSKEVKGRKPRKSDLYNLLQNLRNSDSLAFEFLIGNPDLVKRNFKVQESGKFVVFDYDRAFVIGVSSFENIKKPKAPRFGRVLPDKYSKEFIYNLKVLKPEAIRSKLDGLLTKGEIESVIFRREIILKDFELRSEPLFTKNELLQLPSKKASLFGKFVDKVKSVNDWFSYDVTKKAKLEREIEKSALTKIEDKFKAILKKYNLEDDHQQIVAKSLNFSEEIKDKIHDDLYSLAEKIESFKPKTEKEYKKKEQIIDKLYEYPEIIKGKESYKEYIDQKIETNLEITQNSKYFKENGFSKVFDTKLSAYKWVKTEAKKISIKNDVIKFDVGENAKNVKYFSLSELEQFKATFKKGVLYVDNRPVHTDLGRRKNIATLIVTNDNQIYAINRTTYLGKEIEASSFRVLDNIVSFSIFRANNGFIESLNNLTSSSGVLSKKIVKTIDTLRQKGVDFSGVEIRDFATYMHVEPWFKSKRKKYRDWFSQEEVARVGVKDEFTNKIWNEYRKILARHKLGETLNDLVEKSGATDWIVARTIVGILGDLRTKLIEHKTRTEDNYIAKLKLLNRIVSTNSILLYNEIESKRAVIIKKEKNTDIANVYKIFQIEKFRRHYNAEQDRYEWLPQFRKRIIQNNKYKLIDLISKYRDLIKQKLDTDAKIAFKDLDEFKLTIDKDGLIRDSEKNLYDTNGLVADFVISKNLDIYASTLRRYDGSTRYHSSFLPYSKIAGVGEFIVTRGRAVQISNKSGHYKPSLHIFMQTIEILSDKGISFKGVWITESMTNMGLKLWFDPNQPK